MLLLLDLWRRCTALCFAIIIANGFNFLRRYQPQRKVQSEGSHHLPLRHVSCGIAPRQYGKVSETPLSGHILPARSAALPPFCCDNIHICPEIRTGKNMRKIKEILVRGIYLCHTPLLAERCSCTGMYLHEHAENSESPSNWVLSRIILCYFHPLESAALVYQ